MRGEKAKMKFRLTKGKGSVNRFTDENGVQQFPGDVVDLPVSYKGSAWLEPLEAEMKVKAPAAKLENAKAGSPAEVPLSAKKSQSKVAEKPVS